MGGDLGLGWFGRLARARPRRGIGIRSAAAARDSDHSWSGRLDLDAATASSDPEALNYLALTEEESEPSLELAPIERFRIERTETNAICLRVFAPDRVGLLSALFERMQFLGLFPVRLRVSTDGSLVDDTIWLRGVADHPPSSDAERALNALLCHLSSGSNTEPR
jgi:UTP:GlnB (protein PII) uridylyltransferase